MASHRSPKRAVENPTIPDVLYFKIGEVGARILQTRARYVLRFWESQFPQLKPNKRGTGQRLYRRRNVEITVEIKRLVIAEATRSQVGARHWDRRNAGAAGRGFCTFANVWCEGREEGRQGCGGMGGAHAELRGIAVMLASPANAATPQVQQLRRRTRKSPAENASLSVDARFSLRPLTSRFPCCIAQSRGNSRRCRAAWTFCL